MSEQTQIARTDAELLELYKRQYRNLHRALDLLLSATARANPEKQGLIALTRVLIGGIVARTEAGQDAGDPPPGFDEVFDSIGPVEGQA